MITQEIIKPDIKKENLVSNVSNDNSNNKNVSDKIDLSEIANKNRELKLSSNNNSNSESIKENEGNDNIDLGKVQLDSGKKVTNQNETKFNPISTYNGDACDLYFWSQGTTDVQIQIKLPENTGAKKVKQ